MRYMSSQWQLLKASIPGDHCRQVSAYDMARAEMERPDAPDTVVDLGCGNARSAAVFREVRPDIRWIGLDIEESRPAREVTDEEIHLYDGRNMPLATGSVPLIYSRQVFEHVRYPERVLAEIARVLKPGGIFIGSTSHLEPYHAYSLWNYTPYGFKVLVEAAGLRLLEIRPAIDGAALIDRSFGGKLPEYSRWFVEESPLNAKIEARGWENGKNPALINNLKLELCGQFCFRVRKPANWSPGRALDVTWRDLRADGTRTARAGMHLIRRHVRETVRKVPGTRRLYRATRRKRQTTD
jgi:SAM-dependent methyltransferase